ncbi:hypothetical protein N9N67_05790 [Bacteriovoracaceae bacterium]|nr:hypothetical protein [Bacteriovoracaceae bacterium]
MKIFLLLTCALSLNLSLVASENETCFSRYYEDDWFKEGNAKQIFQSIKLKRIDHNNATHAPFNSTILIEALPKGSDRNEKPYQGGYDYSTPYKKGEIFCESTGGDAGLGDNGCIYARFSGKNLLISAIALKVDESDKGVYFDSKKTELVRCLGAVGDDLDCYGVDKDGNLDPSQMGVFQSIIWNPKSAVDKTYKLYPVQCDSKS